MARGAVAVTARAEGAALGREVVPAVEAMGCSGGVALGGEGADAATEVWAVAR